MPLQWSWLLVAVGAHAAGIAALYGFGFGPQPRIEHPAGPQIIAVSLVTPPDTPGKATVTSSPAPDERKAATTQPARSPDSSPTESVPVDTARPTPPPARERSAPASAQTRERPATARPIPAPAPRAITPRKPVAPTASVDSARATTVTETPPAKPAHDELRPEPAIAPGDSAAESSVTAAPPQPAEAVAAAAPAGSAATAISAYAAARFDAAYLHNPRPVYPAVSRRRGEEGQVVLRVRVLADGRAGEVEIAETSGHPRLDRTARDTVHRWRFEPARRDGAPVDSWIRVPLVFRLEG